MSQATGNAADDRSTARTTVANPRRVRLGAPAATEPAERD